MIDKLQASVDDVIAQLRAVYAQTQEIEWGKKKLAEADTALSNRGKHLNNLAIETAQKEQRISERESFLNDTEKVLNRRAALLGVREETVSGLEQKGKEAQIKLDALVVREKEIKVRLEELEKKQAETQLEHKLYLREGEIAKERTRLLELKEQKITRLMQKLNLDEEITRI